MELYSEKRSDGSYELSTTPKAIALRIIEPISETKRNVTFGDWYTSYELIQELLERHKFTLVDTFQKNRRQIPPELLLTRNRS